LPEPPKSSVKQSAYAHYVSELSRIKSEIINTTLHPVEYHIIRTARGDYMDLKFKIEIKDLWKIILVRMLEETK